MFAHHCYKCHGSDKQKAGLRLDEREAAFAGGESGVAIIKGEPNISELYRRISIAHDDEDSMPPKGKKLTDAEVATIKDWITNGAPCPDGPLQAGNFRRAPLAPRKPLPPANFKPYDNPNPIDQFVAKYLSSKGAAWPWTRRRRHFARRVSLDTLGLVPTYSEVSRFKSDRQPMKHSRFVNKRLKNQREYAENWQRHAPQRLLRDRLHRRRTKADHSVALRRPREEQTLRPVRARASRAQRCLARLHQRHQVARHRERQPDPADAGRTERLPSLPRHEPQVRLLPRQLHQRLETLRRYGFANIFADTPLAIHRCDKPTGDMAETRFLYPELGEILGTAPKQERLEKLAEIVTSEQNGRLSRTFVNSPLAEILRPRPRRAG